MGNTSSSSSLRHLRPRLLLFAFDYGTSIIFFCLYISENAGGFTYALALSHPSIMLTRSPILLSLASAPSSLSGCEYFNWLDPEMTDRGTIAINGLLRKLDQIESEKRLLEEKLTSHRRLELKAKVIVPVRAVTSPPPSLLLLSATSLTPALSATSITPAPPSLPAPSATSLSLPPPATSLSLPPPTSLSPPSHSPPDRHLPLTPAPARHIPLTLAAPHSRRFYRRSLSLLSLPSLPPLLSHFTAPSRHRRPSPLSSPSTAASHRCLAAASHQNRNQIDQTAQTAVRFGCVLVVRGLVVV
ncbi:hypothetical protein Syun_030134 [Stephania yunnanensis]|uniref:Uncharacterized protein n=1 Tax=Stephania yunnanensis TaxID=152371 RepID=A0AAP0E9A3_9MAGN